MTGCSTQTLRAKLPLNALGRRRVDADFSAGRVSSDGGGLLLRELDLALGLTERLAQSFTDHRDPKLLEHTVTQMLRQRIYGLALGYEDLNDYDILGRDPLLATLIGKTDPEGQQRRNSKDRGHGGASASTLGRLERTKADASAKSRYDKIVCDFDALRHVFVQFFIDRFKRAPERLVLDLDPTDVQLHGNQEQRFFHGYYDHHCYLPIFLYCGQFPLAVKLRPSNIDGSKGAVELLKPVVEQLKKAFPKTQFIVRGDSGFCREELMAWCESNGVHYLFGIARNKRLVAEIETRLEKAERKFQRTGRAARYFRSFRYRTLKSWSRPRRVVGKAEYLPKGRNPRFVITSLRGAVIGPKLLYEQLYCARGEMENRIKEQQLDLYGDRASCHRFRANHVRLWLALAAQLLVVAVREYALHGTELARAQASTLRVRLFKIGALVTISVRRVYVRLSSAFPLRTLFADAIERIRALRPPD